MKTILLIVSLLLPVAALAQSPQGMNEQEMQQMMQRMQQMQSCMQDVDQAQLKGLEQRSRQVEADIKSLCTEGKRAEAQQRAMDFGLEISQDPNLKIMRKCGELMRGMMPEMPLVDFEQKTADGKHICDQ
jgi:hypothetical protein